MRDMSVFVALKNTTNSPLSATADFLDPVSGESLLTMPPVQIPAGGAALLHPPLTNLGSVERVAVRIENTGTHGSLIGTLHGTNRVTGIGYELPLRDSGGLSASTGGYPWRLDGDFETAVTVTNVGAAPARFSARLHYGQSDYVFPSRVLAAGATATFDLRRVRDEHTPDQFGHVIPADLDHGQFYWSVRDQSPQSRFSGRAEIVSASSHVTSTFSCPMCCPDTLLSADLQVAETHLGVGIDTILTPSMNVENCYGYFAEYQDPDGWSSDTTYISISFQSPHTWLAHGVDNAG